MGRLFSVILLPYSDAASPTMSTRPKKKRIVKKKKAAVEAQGPTGPRSGATLTEPVYLTLVRFFAILEPQVPYLALITHSKTVLQLMHDLPLCNIALLTTHSIICVFD